MNLSINVALNIYSIILLVIIYFHSLHHNGNEDFADRIYILILQTTIVLLIVDIFSRFDGNPASLFPLFNYWGNFFMYLFSMVLPALWFLYAHNQVFQNERRTRKLIFPMLVVFAANAVLSVLSLSNGWFFRIAPGNVYQRGPLFLVPASLTIGLIMAALVMIIANRRLIDQKYFFALVFFAFPPFVCVMLQIFLYGVSFMLNGVVLSLLILQFNIQNRNMYIDFLTGVNNRKKLDTYLKNKISTCSEGKTFAALLLDIDKFKYINDTYGHDVGDDALVTLAKLLTGCLRANDFIARYGGDEFYIIYDISNQKDLEAAIGRITRCLDKYNEFSAKPYQLELSMGYTVYDYHSAMDVEEFQKSLDQLMYGNKRAQKRKPVQVTVAARHDDRPAAEGKIPEQTMN